MSSEEVSNAVIFFAIALVIFTNGCIIICICKIKRCREMSPYDTSYSLTPCELYELCCKKRERPPPSTPRSPAPLPGVTQQPRENAPPAPSMDAPPPPYLAPPPQYEEAMNSVPTEEEAPPPYEVVIS